MLSQLLFAVTFALPSEEFSRCYHDVAGRDLEADAISFAADPARDDAWAGSDESALDAFCANRYGANCAADWKAVWQKAIRISRIPAWNGTYAKFVVDHSLWQNAIRDAYNDAVVWNSPGHAFPKELKDAVAVFDGLRVLEWEKKPFAERDAIDLARTVADRFIIAARDDTLRAFHDWKKGGRTATEVEQRARTLAELAGEMAELLALHTDYSLAELSDRCVAKKSDAGLAKALVERAASFDSTTHFYETAEHWHKPAISRFCDDIVRRVKTGDRSSLGPYGDPLAYRNACMSAKPLSEMRPKKKRRMEEYCDILWRLARSAEVFVQREHSALGPLVCPAPKTMSLRTSAEWIPLDGSVAVRVACPDAAAVAWVKAHWKTWFGKDVEVSASESALPKGEEAYRLEVSGGGIEIRASHLAGVRHALVTLRQLSMANRGTRIMTHYIAPQVVVEDAPALAWRGLHFCWFPETRVSAVERFVRMAAYLKFNYVVLENWGSFRSEKFPWLGWQDGMMTKAELKRLRTIADDLGVTLVPQINVFGHASLSRGCAGKHAVLDFAPEYQPLFEPIMGWNWCLTNPEARRVLAELIAEMHEAFGNPPYFHLGCDEAQPPSCPECSKGSYSEKVIGHIRAMAEAVEARGARAIIWHDMFLRCGDSRFPSCYRNGSPAMAAHVEDLPRSVVIADWNYNGPRPDGDCPSLRHFHELGFDVLTCPWDDTNGIDAQGRFAQRNPWCGYLGTVWHHYYGPSFRKLLVHGACAAWGGDPKPFREPWDARVMTLLRQVQWDMPVRDRIECGVFDCDLPPQSSPEY